MPQLRTKPTIDIEAAAREALERGMYREAVTELVAVYRDPLFGFCREMMRSDDLADDVLQTTFVQAYRDLPGFKPNSTLRAWLYAIARNRCLDALKRERRRNARFTVVDGEAGADPAPGVDRLLEDNEISDALEDCLGKLAPHIRTAVLLRFQEGFAYREIAEISSEQPAALRARVSRAMPILRSCIENTLGGRV